MSSRSLQLRVIVIAVAVTATLVLLQALPGREAVSLPRPLGDLPLILGDWQGTDYPLEPRIVESAGVDDYLNRAYSDGSGHLVELYVGYYGSQQTGSTIHSPQNCLPGSGWEPVRAGRLGIQTPDGESVVVNEYMIAKGLDRKLVLYWYQRGERVIASEYWAKFYLVTDAFTRNRTDGSLVRLVTPARGGEEQARIQALEFFRVLYPQWKSLVPK